MSDLYNVEAIEKQDNRIVLRIAITHPDVEGIYAKKNFALQVLWDATTALVPCPLRAAISPRESEDFFFMTAVEGDFIAAVRFLEANNAPVEAGIAFLDREDDRGHLSHAVMEIITTEPKWLQHIEAGLPWNSAAYDMESLLY